MTSCPAERELVELVDGELDAAREQALLDHLGACEACCRLLAHGEAALTYALGGLADGEARAPRRPPPATVPVRQRWVALAASVLLALGIAHLAAHRSPGTSRTAPAAAATPGASDLSARLDRLLERAEALAGRWEPPIDYAATAALGAAEVRADLLGPEGARRGYRRVLDAFPGTGAAQRAGAALDALGDER